MKIRHILFALFLSFAGINLVGCGFFGGDDSKSTAKLVEEAKASADAAKEAADKEKADNPNADYSKCDAAIAAADAAKADADAAKAEDDAAAAEDTDAKKAAKDKAKAAKQAAEEAAKSAKNCAQEGEQADACSSSEADFVCTKEGSNTKYGRIAIVKKESDGQCSEKIYFHKYEDESGDHKIKGSDDCSSEDDCNAKKDAWVKEQTDAGYSCS